MQQQINEMLDQGLLEESDSAWAWPVFLVGKKKDGSQHPVIDYQKLNNVALPSNYPLLVITDILKDLCKTNYITTLDLTARCLQVTVKPPHVPKTSFVTPFGQFMSKGMCFELSGAPSTFQTYMDDVLQPAVLGSNAHVFLDDIIITSATFEEHLRLLDRVFKLLHGAGLQLKPSKWQFVYKELIYLGLKITSTVLHANDAKVKAITELPKPQN